MDYLNWLKKEYSGSVNVSDETINDYKLSKNGLSAIQRVYQSLRIFNFCGSIQFVSVYFRGGHF